MLIAAAYCYRGQMKILLEACACTSSIESDHDLAHVLPLLEIRICGTRIFEAEDLVDQRTQSADFYRTVKPLECTPRPAGQTLDHQVFCDHGTEIRRRGRSAAE